MPTLPTCLTASTFTVALAATSKTSAVASPTLSTSLTATA